ncbi:MAG: HAD family hydrolase [Clostridiales bacterium]|jgi:putative hydrolase of the HAD superfamily|nr:HAD family hydrolase [Clostridiales bacterium]
MEKKLIIFIDSGDTIIDEGTEIRDENGIVIHAELIEGAGETLKALYDAGYTIALVADGEVQSFTNVYEQNGLGYCFKTRTISEAVGMQKPARIMFEDAMEKNNLKDEDKKRIVMVGNNVKKDIAGANQFGITSILLDWSPRYDMNPASPEQIPDYIIHKPAELLPLIEKLNNDLQ